MARRFWRSSTSFLFAATLAINLFVGPVPVTAESNLSAKPKIFTYRVVRTLAHSETAFTEGLAFREWDGKLVESTGLRGGSKIILYTIHDDEIHVEKEVMLPDRHFGEGIEFFAGKLYSLTWKNKRMHVFDRHTLEPIDEFAFDVGIYEGWGLTVSPDRSALITGDGSEMLHRLEVFERDLRITDHLAVHDCYNKLPRVLGINELELVPRFISHPEQITRQRVDHPSAMYASLRGAFTQSSPHVYTNGTHNDESTNENYSNRGASNSTNSSETSRGSKEVVPSSDLIWGNIISTMCVAMIDPNSGAVQGWLLLDGIYDGWDKLNKVANGIAYRAIDES
eukprot:CAMPEP_0171532294 /NCGR_PEP_ID=MMETSP0959-20130129/14708_1 /TAXON_ID=87120 /ORGANISM="Aurantiochytrium limacinum, Strain ATCCMYA-1381" /LENGTH=337 /DNA_ID=CAMNT_0012076491 /DNA_START=43 /DNA_END=1053 /DNA_ORIENTATION=+